MLGAPNDRELAVSADAPDAYRLPRMLRFLVDVQHAPWCANASIDDRRPHGVGVSGARGLDRQRPELNADVGGFDRIVSDALAAVSSLEALHEGFIGGGIDRLEIG